MTEPRVEKEEGTKSMFLLLFQIQFDGIFSVLLGGREKWSKKITSGWKVEWEDGIDHHWWWNCGEMDRWSSETTLADKTSEGVRRTRMN